MSWRYLVSGVFEGWRALQGFLCCALLFEEKFPKASLSPLSLSFSLCLSLSLSLSLSHAPKTKKLTDVLAVAPGHALLERRLQEGAHVLQDRVAARVGACAWVGAAALPLPLPPFPIPRATRSCPAPSATQTTQSPCLSSTASTAAQSFGIVKGTSGIRQMSTTPEAIEACIAM